MAKRKRLDLPISPNLETKSDNLALRSRMPIADVAGDTAVRAALEEVSREMTAAEAEGRVVKKLPIAEISTHHISRDRIALDNDEMEVLKRSISERGQQAPIEVLTLPDGGYGLISGLRRVEALRALKKDTVLALVRRSEGSQAAYKAMVEENEIRAGLSFYERANIAVVAVGQGVYPDLRSAIAGLFAHAAPAKRSKIANFVTICSALGKALAFPAAIPEKLGLALAQAIEADRTLAGRIADALRKTPPEDAAAERRALERALKKRSQPKTKPEELAPGLRFEAKQGRVVLSGSALSEEFLDALRNFVVSHAKTNL